MQTCALCGLRVPGAAGEGPAYCCTGCLVVAEVVGKSGDAGSTGYFSSRIGLGAFLSMFVMAGSLYLYGEESLGAAGGGDPLRVGFAAIARYLLLLFSLPIFLLLGVPLVVAGGGRTRWVDRLIATGSFSALAVSAVATLREEGHVYYDAATVTLVLVHVGRYLEVRAKLDAQRAREALRAVLPSAQLEVGARVEVAAGERVQADGVVTAGEAAVDERQFTGESIPRPVRMGDWVYAGTSIVEGTFSMLVERVGRATHVARLVQLVEDARARPSRLERIAEQVAKYFFVFGILGAATAFGFGVAAGGAEAGILRALAVLAIACPCAIGVATPIVANVALTRLAARGILVRGLDVFERLARASRVAFDKTGTLTTGIRLTTDDEWAIEKAASLAIRSEHPLSRAVVALAQERGVVFARDEAAQVVPGKGVVSGGSRLGSAAFVGAASGEPIGARLFYREEGGRVAVFTIEEMVDERAVAGVRELEARGVRMSGLSGDDADRARRFGESVGVAFEGALSPLDKEARVREWQSAGETVVVVGDGVNDAPALAGADVGVAVGGAHAIAVESAHVVLMRSGAAELPTVIAVGRRAVRRMCWNLLWAIAYNAGAVVLAVMGAVSPIIAALAMVASSLFVVTGAVSFSAAQLSEPGTASPNIGISASNVSPSS